MGDNQRQIIRNEETVVAGQPDQTVVSQTQTSSASGHVAAPVAGQASTVQTTTTAAAPRDQVVARNYAERVVDPAAEKAAAVDWVSRVIWFLVGLMSILLAIRFVLLLTGANESAGFAQLIYGLTGWMVAPFAGLFGRPLTYPGAASTGIVEFESLVAIVVYVLIGWLVTKLAQLMLGTNRTTGTVVQETDRETRV
jgi:uncharacterized protein YggT (Ycf19 family)